MPPDSSQKQGAARVFDAQIDGGGMGKTFPNRPGMCSNREHTNRDIEFYFADWLTGRDGEG